MLLLCIVRDFPEDARVLEYSVVNVPEDSGFYVTAKVEMKDEFFILHLSSFILRNGTEE